MFHVPHKFRIRSGQLKSDDSYGNNGAFTFVYGTTQYQVIASDGEGWEHASVSVLSFAIKDRGKGNRCPTWDEMCIVKDMFWDEEDCVIQFHPPKSEYVNVHPHVLHLWRKCGENYETPPKEFIG